MSTDKQLCETIRDMMNKWNERAALLREAAPWASEEEIQEAVGEAFTRSFKALKK